MSYYAAVAASLNADMVPVGAPDATVPYTDEFSSVTYSPANGWLPAGQVVDGAASIAGGDLIYTAGAGDGSQPRITRPINVTPGDWYLAEAPAPTGTASNNEIWIGGDGGAFASALTPVVGGAAMNAVFQAPDPGFGVVWAVLRVGVGWTAGQTARLSEISLTATTAPSMGTPVILENLVVAATTAAAITSGTWSPAANADVIVPFLSRGASVTHDSVTAGFATVAGFTKIADALVEIVSGTWVRLSLWRATTTATPGTGAVTCTGSGTTFQRAVGGIAVANVGSQVATFDEEQASGASIAGTLTGATTGDVAIVCTATAGANTPAFSDGLTQPGNSPLQQSNNFAIALGYKVSPSATQTTTGLSTTQGSVSVGVLLRGAA